jgi:hypothetical protein
VVPFSGGVWGLTGIEYQYYDFKAIDCALAKTEMAAPRAISTCAVITTTLAFEAFEGFADDGLDGGHFIVGQLLKFAFAPLAA